MLNYIKCDVTLAKFIENDISAKHFFIFSFYVFTPTCLYFHRICFVD